LTRAWWQAQRLVRERYWEAVKETDCSQPDREAIIGLHQGTGYRCRITSQAASRWGSRVARPE
jgi:hypothetical protein